MVSNMFRFQKSVRLLKIKLLNGKYIGAPEEIRTLDLCLRRAALYPAELRVQTGIE